MKAIVDQNQKTELIERERRNPVGYQIEVQILYAGLNRRDLMIRKRRGEETIPVTLGSDGVGIVTRLGDEAVRFNVGDSVLINPGLYWDNATVAAPDTLEIVGYPNDGTFSDYYVQDEKYFERKPSFLTDAEAGCLNLSALTAFRAIFTKGQLKKGETVFIPGGASGVSTYLIQFAKAIGARVITTSRNEEKLTQLAKLGADFCLMTTSDWEVALSDESIDLVIDSIGEATFDRSLSVLKKGGRLVTFGATTDDVVSFNVRQFFYQQQTILGSTMGSREELKSMLTFIETHKIHPIIDHIYQKTDYQEAFDQLKQSKHLGKIVLDFKIS